MKPDRKSKTVPFVPRVRKPKKDISKEPEMKELKRMIRDGELDPDRTVDHLEKEDKAEE